MRTKDTEYRELRITDVREEGEHGWAITDEEGWSFGVPADSPVAPRVGMMARYYGQGIGRAVRGLLLDGEEVYYRTAEQDEAHQKEQLYGKDAAEWLARWDAGRSVWSIEMGGLGPGYEQCIQIVAAEVLRHCLATKYDAARWEDKEKWNEDRDAIDKAVSPVVTGLGLSGAQWGAGLSVGVRLYRDGPQTFMESVPEDRKIQVSREFPQLAAR